MGGKKAKLARKFIKNYLQKKDMENKNQVEYTFAQLQTFVNLSFLLTGKKPEKIELVEAYYTWYIQECQNQAEALGLKNEFKDGKVTFIGIPLEKKVSIVTPAVPPTPEVVVPKNN